MNLGLFGGQPVEGSHVNPDQSSGAVNRTVQPNPAVGHGATSQGTPGFHISDAANKRQQIVGDDSIPLSSGTLMQHGLHAGSVANWQFHQLRYSSLPLLLLKMKRWVTLHILLLSSWSFCGGICCCFGIINC